MTEKALFILSNENLDRFKSAALERAKKFDITNILPLYENYYNKIVNKDLAKSSI
jgi:hypothetical protein